MKEYDAAIIGGGIIGLSCGYYLSKKGKKVLILEAGNFASGASGACDDMILFQSKKPGINLELAFESLELYKSLTAELENDLGFSSHGGMVLIQNDQELTIMEDFVRQQRDYGLDVVILDRKDMLKKQPFLGDQFIASTFSPTDSQVDPFLAMSGFLRKGRERGLEMIRQSPVTAVEKEASGNFRITCSTGASYAAGQVVNCGGAWAGKIAALAGLTVPMEPKRGQIVISEKIPAVGDTNLWTANYLVTKLNPEVKIEASPVEQALGLGFAFTRTKEGSYLIGSTREMAGFDKGCTMDGLRCLVNQAVEILPIMENVHFIRSMAGLRPCTPDGKMILGEHRELPGFFTAAGHEGDGISLAPITGFTLAEMVCGGPVPEKFAELSPARFAQTV